MSMNYEDLCKLRSDNMRARQAERKAQGLPHIGRQKGGPRSIARHKSNSPVLLIPKGHSFERIPLIEISLNVFILNEEKMKSENT